MVNVSVNGVLYPVPSAATDTDWAAAQLAFEQALAAGSMGRLYSSAQAIGSTADNLEDNLMTYTLPAGLLALPNKQLRVTGWGTGINTATVTTVRAYVGSTRIIQFVLAASQNNTWQAVMNIASVSQFVQTASGILTAGINSVQQSNAAGADDGSTALLVRFTGQKGPAGTTAGAVTQLGMLVELIP